MSFDVLVDRLRSKARDEGTLSYVVQLGVWGASSSTIRSSPFSKQLHLIMEEDPHPTMFCLTSCMLGVLKDEISIEDVNKNIFLLKLLDEI